MSRLHTHRLCTWACMWWPHRPPAQRERVRTYKFVDTFHPRARAPRVRTQEQSERVRAPPLDRRAKTTRACAHKLFIHDVPTTARNRVCVDVWWNGEETTTQSRGVNHLRARFYDSDSA